VVAKDQLHGRLFPLESEAKADAIEVYVHRLRRKLAGARVRIVTLRGLGYLLEEVKP
jgi:two-component system response regulator TctD